MQTTQARSGAVRARAVAQSLRRDPRAEAAYQKGLKEAKRERWREAAQAYERAVALNPDDAVFWLNLANSRVKLGESDKAVEAARRALAIDPASELAVAIASQCLAAANRHQETIELLQSLDLAKVESPSPYFALGNAHMALFRHDEAIKAFLEGLRRKPDFTPAHISLGNVFERMKMHEEARECFRTAIELGGNRAELLSAMAHQSQHACRWDLLAQDLAELQCAFAQGLTQASPFQLVTMPSTRAQQLAAAQAKWKNHYASVKRMPRPGARRGGDRMRIGYMSNDLFRHATAYLIAEILERHDRARFDVRIYSFGINDGSEIRQRIIDGAGVNFAEVSQLSDQDLANRIRSDDIDILVDLKGYTLNARCGVFSYHPARIQVNYLGFPGTIGSDCHEYIIGDRIVTPLEHADSYSEKIAQMPHCYQPNDRRRRIGPRPTRAQCGLPETGFIFCSFNSVYKITAEVFDRWCRLLHQVDGSVLWLYEANTQGRRNLDAEVRRRGIDPQRIVWAPHQVLEPHLGRLQLADLSLDTLPVNAHTTASDALWAGVPMITTPGESFVSRVASSILCAAGLDDLIAPDGDAYERLALDLARNPDRLCEIRARLAANRDECSLFDSARYTRDLEALYERMIAAWERCAPAEHLPAAAQ
jgi:predicted O-linked N-acetylglucosamine transferase (SPINDLY family)